MTKIYRYIAVVIIAACLTAAPKSASADGWELRTAEEVVPGTREIEEGNFAEAIRTSMVHLPHASQKKKVAVLNNLCIAYIVTKDFAQAKQYCDQAIERPNEKAVSYNNRGVLRALQGDIGSAMDDFAFASTAGCIGTCSGNASTRRDLPRPIARRNLGRAEQLAKQAVSASDNSVAASID